MTNPEDKVVILRINPDYQRVWGALPKAEFKALKQSIQIDGLLEKLKVNPDNVLLDGHNRREALRELGLPVLESMIEIIEPENEMLYIIRSQINRRHATPYHRIENAIPLLEIERQRARERMLRGDPTQIFGEGMTNEIIGKLIGLSHETVRKALYIVEHGDVIPGLKEKLRRGVKPSVDNAYRQVRELIEPKPTPVLPEGVYNVIYADPPWAYSYKLRGAPDDHYPTMKTEEICKLEVPKADDAVLFLWATNPKIEDALEVIKAWGFDYKTNRAWIKDKIGTGYYFRGQHELLLLATRGSMGPPPMAVRMPSVFHAPRREHSQKPDEIYDMIETMYPGHNYIELFARNEKREGWEMWGIDTR